MWFQERPLGKGGGSWLSWWLPFLSYIQLGFQAFFTCLCLVVVCNGSNTRALMSVVNSGFTSQKIFSVLTKTGTVTSVKQRRGATCGATELMQPALGKSWQAPASPGPALEVVPILLKDIPHSTILPLCVHTEVIFWGGIE